MGSAPRGCGARGGARRGRRVRPGHLGEVAEMAEPLAAASASAAACWRTVGRCSSRLVASTVSAAACSVTGALTGRSRRAARRSRPIEAPQRRPLHDGALAAAVGAAARLDSHQRRVSPRAPPHRARRASPRRAGGGAAAAPRSAPASPRGHRACGGCAPEAFVRGAEAPRARACSSATARAGRRACVTAPRGNGRARGVGPPVRAALMAGDHPAAGEGGDGPAAEAHLHRAPA